MPGQSEPVVGSYLWMSEESRVDRVSLIATDHGRTDFAVANDGADEITVFLSRL
jgi:hypothetical protein